jgi:hypothetical protein
MTALHLSVIHIMSSYNNVLYTERFLRKIDTFCLCFMSTRNYIRLIWTKIKLAQQNNTNFHQNPLNSFIDGSCGWRGITSLLWVFFLFTLHKADVKILYMICQTQFVTWHVYKYRSDVDLKSFDTSFNSQSTYASSQL